MVNMKGFDNVGSELPFKIVQIENAEHQREVKCSAFFWKEVDFSWGQPNLGSGFWLKNNKKE